MGWHHIYLGAGNHLVVRGDKWKSYQKEIADIKDPVDLYSEWEERARRILH